MTNAAHKGRLEVVQCLITELGIDVDHADDNGCLSLFTENDGLTNLYAAAKAGYLNIVRCLVEFAADVNQRTKYGNMLLMVAAYFMNHKIVRYLLKHGADAQAKQALRGPQ
jgi:ankyrin repeat protein